MDGPLSMSKICRFCLQESAQEMHEVTEENDICLKLQLSMGVVIKPLEDPLPRKICNSCSEKVDDIYDFHRKLMKSEEILIQYVTEGRDLNKLYHRLKTKTQTRVDNDLSLDNKENETINFAADNIKSETVDLRDPNIDEESNIECANYEPDDLLDVEVKEEEHLVTVVEEKPSSVNIMQFKCLTCFESLESKNLLLNHYNTKHLNKDKTGSSGDNFTIVSSIDGTILFRCNDCNKEYDHKKAIVRHNLQAHVNERPLVCKLCGRTYKTASEIVRHSRAHNGTRLFCSKQCGYSTVYLGALKEHEKRHNKSQLKYKCEKCGKGFQVKTWYEQHQNVHTGLKPFVCDICGVAFHMDRYLTSHRSAMHPQSSNLKRYVCVHCSHPCDSQNALTQHLKEHGINTSFLCDLCGKTLSNGKQLNFHKRMHRGEKPFSCSTCNKTFTKKYNLQLHERTHTGEKSHACLLCGKYYSQRSTLRMHNARHHSTEQLKCSKCIKTFPSQSQYAAHKKLCI